MTVNSTILIVEDDPMNMKLARFVLQANGYQTIEAGNGAEAIEVARRERPALILMDIQMPVMDGIAATKSLKSDETTRNIPVLAFTALATKGDEERFLAEGIDGYIAKPIHKEEFLNTLRQFLLD